MRNIFLTTILCALCLAGYSQQNKERQSKGHSHNDYKQAKPFLTAYFSGMQSIEADVFLKNGSLYVAHEAAEIKNNRTLLNLYLDPLWRMYKTHGHHVFADSSRKLQIVIDIKENHKQVIPELLKEIAPYRDMFDATTNPDAVQLVISGDMPAPNDFKQFDQILQFDGRPFINYNILALARVAMISDNLKNYVKWDGTGDPTPEEAKKMQAVIDKAHAQNKPFRFWASSDNINAWKVLEKLGVDWINTDHPEDLYRYYANKSVNASNCIICPIGKRKE